MAQAGILEDDARLARAVRDACVAAAAQAWEEAGISGLCAEGRWEHVLGVLRELDVEAVARGVALHGRDAGE